MADQKIERKQPARPGFLFYATTGIITALTFHKLYQTYCAPETTDEATTSGELTETTSTYLISLTASQICTVMEPTHEIVDTILSEGIGKALSDIYEHWVTNPRALHQAVLEANDKFANANTKRKLEAKTHTQFEYTDFKDTFNYLIQNDFNSFVDLLVVYEQIVPKYTHERLRLKALESALDSVDSVFLYTKFKQHPDALLKLIEYESTFFDIKQLKITLARIQELQQTPKEISVRFFEKNGIKYVEETPDSQDRYQVGKGSMPYDEFMKTYREAAESTIGFFGSQEHASASTIDTDDRAPEPAPDGQKPAARGLAS